MRIFTTSSFLEEAHEVIGNAAEIAPLVGRDNTKQTLAGFLGQVGLLENALGRVDVRKVEGSSRMARVEDGRQPDPRLERLHHDPVHLIVRYVADLPEIDGINNLVVAIGLIAV